MVGDVIVWVKNLLLFFYIMNGKLKGYGICDVMIDKLDVLLVDFDISVEIYLYFWVNKYVGEVENLCFFCMIKWEDFGIYIYSDIIMYYFVLGVIIYWFFLIKFELFENIFVFFVKLMFIYILVFGLLSVRKYFDVL